MLNDQVIETQLANKLKRGDGYTINSFIELILRGEDFLDGKTKAIKTPTLALWGKDDGLTPLGIGKAFVEDIPGAQLVVIDNCGHVPQMEKAAEFNAALLKFLGGAQTAQAPIKRLTYVNTSSGSSRRLSSTAHLDRIFSVAIARENPDKYKREGHEVKYVELKM